MYNRNTIRNVNRQTDAKRLGLKVWMDSRVGFSGGRLTVAARKLEQPEVDFDLRLHGDRFPVQRTWLEFPLQHGFDCLFIKSQSEGLHDLRVDHFARGIDFDVKQHGAL